MDWRTFGSKRAALNAAKVLAKSCREVTVFKVQAPILVFREWHRHRTQNFNEMSARYVPLADANASNKQAGTKVKSFPSGMLIARIPGML